MELHVKNMVCDRCIKSVKSIFEQNGIIPESVYLGHVKLIEEIDPDIESKIREQLNAEGFEMLDDQKAKFLERIKAAIIELVHYGELDEMNKTLSAYLTEKLGKDYHYISHLFSSMENSTIEQYFILQKIEKVKEWLVYGEYSLGGIAFKLGYSSVAHLSAQFKKITGFTPSQFKQLKDHQRKPLDKI